MTDTEINTFKDYNQTAAEYPREKTIHQLFEEQANRTPDQVAVVYEENQLTYRELNEKANQIARTLQSEGVHPDQPVGIMAERSLEMIVGLFGILKAGGAYVPIDPTYPEERIRYILEDSDTKLLLVQHHLREKVPLRGKCWIWKIRKPSAKTVQTWNRFPVRISWHMSSIHQDQQVSRKELWWSTAQ